MARARIVVVGLMVFCLLAAGAMAGSSSSKHGKGGDDDGDDTGDDDVANFSKKDYKECYKANPGCTGECRDVDDDGELECVAPEDAEDDFDLCGGTKKGSGNWAVWEDGDAACTCASGFVTAAKIRSKYENSNKLPPAKDLCTVECSGEVECTDGDGPLDCFCLDGDDDEGAEEYISKKDQADANKEISDAAKDEYKDAVDEAKDLYKEAMDDIKSEYENAKDEAKDAFENAKADKGDDDAKSEYKDAVADAKSDFENAKADIKEEYENAKADAKEIYEQAKGNKHNKGGDDDGTDDDVTDDDGKKAAPKKTETKVAAPAKPVVAAAAAPAKPVVAPATPAAPKA